MSVSQQDIADRLGIDRTAVTKILNRTPGHSASKKTIEVVFKTAREMGYDFSRLRHTHGRRFERKPVQWQADLHIKLDDGSIWASGFGIVRNVSSYGAMVTDLDFKEGVLPIKPFMVVMTIKDGELKGVTAECEVIRFKSHPYIDMGLNVIQISDEDRDRIHQYVP